MVREYQGRETKSKGPIVVCVDESGSMSGEKIAQAKAFALAMAWIAMHQKRSCALVGFHSGMQWCCVTLMPGKWKADELLAWLKHFYNGGTDLAVPCVRVPEEWNLIRHSPGKADMIIITDGCLQVPPAMEKNFNEWKQKEEVHVVSMIVGTTAPEMEKISDEVYPVSSLDVESDAVQKCFEV
jgi:uncharacterized protein with von Willebrand factor type A (vWA) domain